MVVVLGLLATAKLHANPFELIMRGTLTPVNTSSPDACDINGSDFLLRFTGNTDKEADNVTFSGGNQTVNTYITSPTGLLVDIEITNRPNSQPDIIFEDVEALLQVRDADESSSFVDRLILILNDPVMEQSFTLGMRTVIELDGTASFWPGFSVIPNLNFLEQNDLASGMQFGNFLFSGGVSDNNCGNGNSLAYVTLGEDASFELNITEEEVTEELPLMSTPGLIGLGLLLMGVALFLVFRMPALR